MRQPDKTTNNDFDEAELIGEAELDVEEFIGAMAGESAKPTTMLKTAEPSPPQRAGWRRVDDWRDARWLREQLSDWDDLDADDAI